MENAAPELRTSVHVTVSPTIDTGCPGVSMRTARTLVMTSTARITAATATSSRTRRRDPAPVASSAAETGCVLDSSLTAPSSQRPLTRNDPVMHDSAMSRVVVVTTGGTIASVADDRGVLRPAHTGAELLGDASDWEVETIDVMAKDSSQLTVADWDRIASATFAAIDDGADGVVITHGTDTLEETALWLELTYGGAAPVVLTGAAKSADAPDADGPTNLRDAVGLAGSA